MRLSDRQSIRDTPAFSVNRRLHVGHNRIVRSWARALVVWVAVTAGVPASGRAGQRSLDCPRAADDKVVQLAKRAFAALEAGRGEEAEAAFRELIAKYPAEPLVHLGAAQAAYLRGQDQTAREELAIVLQLAPDLAIARYFLGQVLHRTGELDEAIRVFEALAAQAPDEPEIAATLARWRTEAEVHGRMRQSVGTHFTVSFEGPSEAALASRALELLEAAYWRIAQLLATYPERPIEVGAVHEGAVPRRHAVTGLGGGRLRRYHPRSDPRRPQRRCEGARSRPRPRVHPCAHLHGRAARRAAVAARGPRVSPRARRLVVGGADDRSRGAIRLDTLEGGFTGSDAADAKRSYAMSGLAGRRLLEEAGGPAVGSLLSDLGNGVPLQEAFLNRALQSLDDFQARLAEAYPPAQK